MITGIVTADGIPQVALDIAGQVWPVTIDTGFNGDLELPDALRPSVQPRLLGPTEWLLAAAQRVVEDLYEVQFPFDEATVTAEATFVPENSILIGTGLLTNHRLTIDFVAKTVLLERIN